MVGFPRVTGLVCKQEAPTLGPETALCHNVIASSGEEESGGST